jgi:hypothetical protein
MLRASNASVTWDSSKKRWEIHIRFGAEVIKRPLLKEQQNAADDVLRSLALKTAEDEGYALEPAQVSIAH